MTMLRLRNTLAGLLLAVTLPVLAALEVGATAPEFTAQATLGGKEFQFSLAEALKKGPVVLYFYPAAFTKGCTIEAHKFAEATEQFNALGATVIGVSKDDIETLHKFSISECRSKFAVAADPGLKIAKSYDAKVPVLAYADRTSFVIVPGGKIQYVYSAMNPDMHVANTLAAVQAWKAAHGTRP
ncbi:peroxiredoxin [Panacagrimonas perspica]|uniref:thioredoxin-dependent peroxiredoxin n=1 Tax=Panacagrimonas perspica TaxID=381431 RepID=A0A4R7P1C2_9GAMM|nr:peroxiredoxin [Panacagrimonas perspica]TDU26650.1 peroxiredoxin [Panacagrimonas perspica]THD04006.1 peroxiredoxin [Panacagrimonas perspica]